MKRIKKKGIEFLIFDLLTPHPEVVHGVFMNLPQGESSQPNNFRVALHLMGLKQGVKLRQCHKADLLDVPVFNEPIAHFENYDGMLTQQEGVGLLVRHADCQGTIFYDPENRALATVHCGWRGSVQNIYQKTIDEMWLRYGTHPKNLLVCIGPSLGPTYAEFKHYREELPPAFWPFQVRPTYFDFWALSAWQLKEAGVPEEQIEIARLCTYALPECYSYRRSQGKTLHHGTIAGLKIS